MGNLKVQAVLDVGLQSRGRSAMNPFFPLKTVEISCTVDIWSRWVQVS